MDAPQASTTPQTAGRHDAVAWVLTSVTAAVLLIGVLVVRSTRSDHSQAIDPSRADDAPLIVVDSTPARPRVIVALPEPEAPAAPAPPPPSTADRPQPAPFDRR